MFKHETAFNIDITVKLSIFIIFKLQAAEESQVQQCSMHSCPAQAQLVTRSEMEHEFFKRMVTGINIEYQ